MSAAALRAALVALVVGPVMLLPSGCDWAGRFTLADPAELIWRSASLTLAWDPPATDVPHSPCRVEFYEVYYRDRASGYWHFLDQVPASAHPEYTVRHETVGSGLFVFAVRAVSCEGWASPLHSSLENSADPISGWYVNWIH